jgi:nitronate monooxygenase
MHRALRNATFVRWEAAGCPAVGGRPGEGDVLATHPDGKKLLRYNSYSPGSDLKGSISELVMYAGEGVGDINDLPGAAELVHRLWAECRGASAS